MIVDAAIRETNRRVPKTREIMMKLFILTMAVTLGLATAAMACPAGYYPCGTGNALCCPQ